LNNFRLGFGECEKELNESDEKEKNLLFLSSMRRYTCSVRQDIFSKLRDAIEEYGKDHPKI
jgi:hypothetical protein